MSFQIKLRIASSNHLRHQDGLTDVIRGRGSFGGSSLIHCEPLPQKVRAVIGEIREHFYVSHSFCQCAVYVTLYIVCSLIGPSRNSESSSGSNISLKFCTLMVVKFKYLFVNGSRTKVTVFFTVPFFLFLFVPALRVSRIPICTRCLREYSGPSF